MGFALNPARSGRARQHGLSIWRHAKLAAEFPYFAFHDLPYRFVGRGDIATTRTLCIDFIVRFFGVSRFHAFDAHSISF